MKKFISPLAGVLFLAACATTTDQQADAEAPSEPEAQAETEERNCTSRRTPGSRLARRVCS